MEQPLNVAIPADAAIVRPPLQVSVPLAGLVVIASVIEFVAPATVFPPVSTTRTTGCVDQAAPAVPPDGWAVIARLAAGPTVMSMLVVWMPVSPTAVAVRV